MAICLGVPSPGRSSDYESGTGRPMCFQLSCTRWGLHDGQVARPPVRSYRTFPPLPKIRRYLSVALALESPPPAVSWHPALRCSDFPHASRHAAARLPHRINPVYPIISLPQVSHSTCLPERMAARTEEGNPMLHPPHCPLSSFAIGGVQCCLMAV